jgi:hypothetical protein
VNAQDARKLRQRQRRIQRRLKNARHAESSEKPVFSATSPRYEVSGRVRCVRAGGIGAVHAMAKRVGLVDAIDESLELLKVHLPYHESDHVLNLAYNVLAGHTCLEDLELLRHDESYMDMLGARRLPDPTTAGDFLRRFSAPDIEALMDAINGVRTKMWERLPKAQRTTAVIDVDGTLVGTTGEKKDGMALAYNGIWGYHPLLVSLANFKEPLFVVNRPGNVPSHQDAALWIDQAIALCRGSFDDVLVRGDTDFKQTRHLDRWDDDGVRFVFGYDAQPNLVKRADALPDTAWSPLDRRAKHEVATRPREKRASAKEAVVVARKYRNIRLQSEQIAEIAYRPHACRKTYRLVIVRKNLSLQKGEQWLWDDWRYFFYLTNDRAMSAEEVVRQANERCDQENLIGQLKSGVNALRVPVCDLESNWAYMVIASLAWSLKAWFGMTLPRAADRVDIVRMHFKRFVHAVMLVPCQVLRQSRRVVLRLVAYTSRARLLFRSMEATARLAFT